MIVQTLTRFQPPAWSGFDRRVDDAMLRDVLGRLGDPEHAFVCGPTPFVEAVASGLVLAGIETNLIRTERFGPSG